MSFYSALIFYRPTPPPRMTGDDLAKFIDAIGASHKLHGPQRCLQVKFGGAIDQDTHETTWEEEVTRGIWELNTIEWDLELSGEHDPTIEQMATALRGVTRIVYRAHMALGTPSAETLSSVTRKNSPENDIDFCPDTLSIDIGPVLLSDLDREDRVCVGWMRVGFSGYGYLWPWTLAYVVKRAESSDAIVRLMNVCREFWPVTPEKPSRALVKFRKSNPNLWPYESSELHADWFWGYVGT